MTLGPAGPASLIALTIEEIRAQWIVVVDASAEAARGRFVTPGAGQAMVYLRKESEARRFLALDAPTQAAQEPGAAWPYLSAEINVTAATLAGVASAIVAQADAWDAAAATIEGVRLAAKAVIAQADSDVDCREAAEDAMAAWPVA